LKEYRYRLQIWHIHKSRTPTASE